MSSAVDSSQLIKVVALLGGQVFEACSGCHANGSPKGVDMVHKK